MILARSRNRCECAGECGDKHAPAHLSGQLVGALHHVGWRCLAVNGEPHPATGSRVVLTVAHLDHDPRNSDPDNLRAMCQRCHNRYDLPARRANAQARRRAATGQILLEV